MTCPDGAASLPQPRGPLSEAVAATLARPPGRARLSPDVEAELAALDEAAGYVHDGDAQLALWMLLELHHRGFEGVDDEWEWQPDLSRIRAVLARRLEDVVRSEVTDVVDALVPAMVQDPGGTLWAALGDGSHSPLARQVGVEATLDQWRELLVLRSVSRPGEGDAHAWALPRTRGEVAVALAGIQHERHGSGDPKRRHAALFARALAGSGLDATYGVHVDRVPAVVLAVTNFVVVCGLQRRLLGETLGHLAMRRATSTVPHSMYAAAARRLGLGEDVTDFFDEHVTADAHDRVTVTSLSAPYVDGDAGRARQVLLGALGGAWLDDQLGDLVLDAWHAGASALLPASTGVRRGGTPPVQLRPDGPVLVRGAGEWMDRDGGVHLLPRSVATACGCGGSAQQPWCDGTHTTRA